MELALLDLELIWDPSGLFFFFFFSFSSPFKNENVNYPPLHFENTSLVPQDHRREIHLRIHPRILPTSDLENNLEETLELMLDRVQTFGGIGME